MSFFERQEEASDIFGRLFTYYVLGFGGLCLFFFVMARPVVLLMTQPAFHQAYLTVGLSATAQFLIGAFSFLLPGIYFAKEMKYVSLVQAIATLASVVLNYTLIRNFGVLGAALGLALGMLVLVVVQHQWNRRRRYLPVRYEWARIRVFGIVFLGYAIVTLSDVGLFGGGLLVFVGILGALIPGWLYFLLTTEERGLLRGAVGPVVRGMPRRLFSKV
jgi:O-antigen/teichoic acid export membrane protein